MSEDDTDDEVDFEALKKKLDHDWDLGLPRRQHYRPLPSLEVQLASRTQCSTDAVILETDFTEHENENSVLNLEIEDAKIIQELQLSQLPDSKIKNHYPGRNTFDPSISGSLFTSETTLMDKQLFGLPQHSRTFAKYVASITREMRDKRLICLETFFMGYSKLLTEEKHIIGKYVLFIMSIQQDQSTVDLCFQLLSYFGASWTPTMEDFLQVFTNWGISKELLHPPFKVKASVTVDQPHGSSTTPLCLQDANIFKVLDHLLDLYSKKPCEGWWHSAVILRALLLMWLDERFIFSLERSKFSIYVSCIVDTIDRDEWTAENINAILASIGLPDEHPHNQAWVIGNFLSNRSIRMQQLGRRLAIAFFQRLLELPVTAPDQVAINDLQNILMEGIENFKQLDLYMIHILLTVLDHFIMTFIEEDMSESVQAAGRALGEWISNGTWFSFLSNIQCLDLHIVKAQILCIKIKLNVFINHNNFVLVDEVNLKQLASLIAKK